MNSRYYSIIVDCTRDKSKVEQTSLIVRFCGRNSVHNNFEPREHFLGFLLTVDTTGIGLTELILKELEKIGLPLKNLRGQGYDNGANMKGAISGVQSRILQVNPRAFFVPCSCHSLNLVINDAASASSEIISFFSNVQKLYLFFSSSTQR